jgi:hypothetical protein
MYESASIHRCNFAGSYTGVYGSGDVAQQRCKEKEEKAKQRKKN